MAYIDYADVSRHLQHITINETSDPNQAEVTVMIDEVEAEMNARFNAVGIDTPITEATALKVVANISLNETGARVLRSIELSSESAIIYHKLYVEAMKNIENNPNILDTGNQTFTAPDGSGRGTPHFSREGQDW